jgi:hypothetical protein
MARSLSLPLGMVVLSLSAAPVQADTIYQCTGKDGAPVLQNVPCEAGSEVWVQKDAGEAKSAPQPRGAAPSAAGAGTVVDVNDAAVSGMQDAQNATRDAAAGDASSADSDALANLPSEPALGMSQPQVKAILGEPTSITQEEVVQGKQITWTYGDSRVLQFDTSGQLTKK